jgi:hypothetical protein
MLSFPHHPNQLWGPCNLLSNGYWELFLWGLSGWAVKLTTHLQLAPRSRKCGSMHPLPHTPSWRSISYYYYYYYYLTAIGLMPGGSVTEIGRTYKKWTYIARKQNIQLTRKQHVQLTKKQHISQAEGQLYLTLQGRWY